MRPRLNLHQRCDELLDTLTYSQVKQVAIAIAKRLGEVTNGSEDDTEHILWEQSVRTIQQQLTEVILKTGTAYDPDPLDLIEEKIERASYYYPNTGCQDHW